MENNTQFQIFKSNDEKRLVFGWANVAIRADGQQIIDHQGDLWDTEDLEEAVYDYVLEFRDAGEEHIPALRKKGRLVESVVFTREKMQVMGIPEGLVPEGWWIGFKVFDDDTWQKIKSGHYSMFSIEGSGIRQEVAKSVLSFNELLRKYNKNHDPNTGRFSSGGGKAGDTDGHSTIETVSDIDYNDSKAVEKVLGDFEQKHLNSDVEHAAVITKQNMCYQIKGKASSVHVELVGDNALKDAIITHNHTDKETDYTLSKDDLELMATKGAKEIRGFDPKYRYVARNKGTSVEILQKARYDIIVKARKSTSVFEYEENFWHNVNQMLQDQGVMSYTRERIR